MIVDPASRQRLIDRQNNKVLNDGLASMGYSIKEGLTQKDYGPTIEMVSSQLLDLNTKLADLKNQKFQLTTEEFDKSQKLLEVINQNMSVFQEIKDKIDKGQTIVFPKETQLSGAVTVSNLDQLPPLEIKNFPEFKIPKRTTVEGKIDVGSIDSLPDLKVTNLSEVTSAITTALTSLQNMTMAAIKANKTTVPTSVGVEGEVKIADWSELLLSIDEVVKGLNILINQEKAGVDGSTPMKVEIVADLPRLIPQPVTNININALQGFVKTTANTVGTTVVQLPNYGQLFNRRAVQIYNNSSNTIYIGGSDVLVANGIPVPAGAYSSIIDAGYNMTVYGIASTSNNDIRVLEVSKDQTTNVQE